MAHFLKKVLAGKLKGRPRPPPGFGDVEKNQFLDFLSSVVNKIIAISVTRWLYYLFNIWSYNNENIPIAYKFAKIG